MPIQKNQYQSTERLYLNAAGQVVSAGDPSRQSLLVSAGGVISLEQAQKYGLVDAEGNPVEVAAKGKKAKSAPPQNKAVSVPKEDK